MLNRRIESDKEKERTETEQHQQQQQQSYMSKMWPGITDAGTLALSLTSALNSHDCKSLEPLKHFLYPHSQLFSGQIGSTGKTNSVMAWSVRL